MVFSQSLSSLNHVVKSSTSNILFVMDPRNINVKTVLSESWLVVNLAIELAMAMGSRLTWIWMFFRFFFYVSLLLIPFVRAGFVFMISDYIKRGIKYGPNPRNYLDIYFASDIMTRSRKHKHRQKQKKHDNEKLPRLNRRGSSHRVSMDNKYPVVIFLSGGAWIIGYKAWGCFMGMLLAQLGVIFVAPDYRNFPQGTISDMVTDATTAIQWTYDNIHHYGGDRNKIYVVSQSAGAHIGALTMLLQARKIEIYKKLKSYLIQLKHFQKQTKHKIDMNTTTNMKVLNQTINEIQDELLSDKYQCLWNPQKNLKAFVGIAGPYNLQDMKLYLDERGLYTDVIYNIMEHDLRKHSPFYCLYDLFISEKDYYHHNKRKSKSMDKINSMNPNLPFVSMTEIEYNGDDDDEDEEKKNESSILIKNGMQSYISECNYDERWKDIFKEKVELNLPSMYLFHGANDLSVPLSNTTTFSKSLANYGVKTYIKIYPNKSHTRPIIEDPIMGKDPLLCDMLKIIYPNLSLDHIVHDIEDAMTGGIRVPDCVVSLASFVCPF